MESHVLHTAALSKRYGATVALSDVSLGLAEGEVHAILGENGAGKSTLVKIMSGVVQPNSGEMTLAADTYRPQSILQARAQGVATAFQELSLIPNLTVGENLLLPRASKTAFWPESRSGILRRAAGLLSQWDISDITADAIVEDLSLAERQRIEIARALSHATRLLILDEPTAALPDPEWLFRQIKRLSSRGIAVMYISHRLGEVREICQRATVLRNGNSIDTVDLSGVDDDGIFSMMVGRSPDSAFVEPAEVPEDAQVILGVRNLNVGKVRSLDLALRAGEIVGVAALEGQGQQDLFQALGGVIKFESGEISVGGKAAELGSPRRAINAGAGIAFVPEERKTEGIFANLTAASNITLPKIDQAGQAGIVYSGLEKNFAADVVAKVALSPRYLDFKVGNLSGGNQQKVLLARALITGAKCLVLFDPARGVDVGTKQSIYAMMRDHVAAGGTVLFYSSELSELVHLSTRCLVIYDGQVVANVPRAQLTEERLLAAAHGHNQEMKIAV
ncbi:MAG: sugar ABC transporter ATP-binding protein [Rhodobiaceae bacterium]|nr:sugar ABC transporter ATP-binding protein [Rhodobiaceae bacterium]MCC0012796.1 sugar ABC transporter ATP-binding protein [Rhodobiaceae bacterium]MCC0051112.1 sugar ABC transporter ATP-binding protein [Rhodobiaceae bacterium]MCC0060177.1 sugar ABC transporter ATP-binding protein [Rhodobiaceae bacterium]